MNKETDKVMGKIAALMEKTEANGATPAEAAQAAGMAQKLIAKYHIDMRGYMPDDTIDKEQVKAQRRWMQMLADVVAENMCCTVVIESFYSGSRAVFIGRESDRTAAIMTYKGLVGACKEGIQAEKQNSKDYYGHSRGVEAAYSNGFLKAVKEEMGKQCRALCLVVSEEVKKATHKEFPNVVYCTVRNCAGNRRIPANGIEEAYQAGIRAGHDVAGRRMVQ